MVLGLLSWHHATFLRRGKMEELLEIYSGEVPENIAELYDKVLNLFHKKANGQLDLQVACLVAVLADELTPPTKPAKPVKKTERAVV